MQRAGRRSKRKGRIDYKKLSLGGDDWKPGENVEEKPKKAPKEKTATPSKQQSSTASTSHSIETYLMMLFVTLEQEEAVRELFKDNGWNLLKADLSALTDKTGSTLLTSDKTGKRGKHSVKTPVKSARTVAVKREFPNDSDVDDDNDEDFTVPTKYRKKRYTFPAVAKGTRASPGTKPKTKAASIQSEETKLDGTASVTEDNTADSRQAGEEKDNKDDEHQDKEEFPSETDETPQKNKADKTEGTNTEERESDVDEESVHDDDESEMFDGEDETARRCWECEEVLEDEIDYAEHMLSQHCFDVKTGRYYCNSCDKYFKQPDYLRDHIKHIHEGKQRKPQKVTRDHICEICGRAFKRKDQLKEHTSMVHFKTPLNEHQCDICGKKFPRPRLLGYHMNKHIGDKPFECKTCGNSYFSRGGLYVHSRMCQRLSPIVHQCEVCQKTFSNQYAKKIHMVGVHAKNVPAYKCVCGAFLKWKSSIKKHSFSCPSKAETVTEITRDEYDANANAAATLQNQKRKALKADIGENMEEVATEEQVFDIGEEEKDGAEVTEVTDEKLVEEITGKIADELSKSGKVDTAEEKIISETIRNAVMSSDETQVITIPRSSGPDSEDNVYYVIVNPSSDQQILS